MFCAPLNWRRAVPDALVESHHYLLGETAKRKELASHARAYGDWLANPLSPEAADGRFRFFTRRSVVSLRGVAAVPLASRLGIGAVLGYLRQGLQLARGGWVLLATSMRSPLFGTRRGVPDVYHRPGVESSKLWQLRRSIFGVGAAQVL